VLGTKRWDRDRAGAKWRRSEQLPALRVPQPAWGSRATNAYVLGQARVDGRPAWLVSFVNPSTPAWFTVAIDRKSLMAPRLTSFDGRASDGIVAGSGNWGKIGRREWP